MSQPVLLRLERRLPDMKEVTTSAEKPRTPLALIRTDR